MTIQEVKNVVTSQSIMNIDEYSSYTASDIQELLSFCTTKIQDDKLSKDENEVLFWNIEFLFDLSNNKKERLCHVCKLEIKYECTCFNH